jgi:hypothetical protein
MARVEVSMGQPYKFDGLNGQLYKGRTDPTASAMLAGYHAGMQNESLMPHEPIAMVAEAEAHNTYLLCIFLCGAVVIFPSCVIVRANSGQCCCLSISHIPPLLASNTNAHHPRQHYISRGDGSRKRRHWQVCKLSLLGCAKTCDVKARLVDHSICMICLPVFTSALSVSVILRCRPHHHNHNHQGRDQPEEEQLPDHYPYVNRVCCV